MVNSSSFLPLIYRDALCMLYFTGEYEWLKSKSINYREMFAVLLAVSTFGHYLRNNSALMNIDNKGMQQALQAGKSKDQDIMALIRCIYFYTSINNVYYRTIFLEGKTNIMADHLSRGRIREFRHLCPTSEVYMTKPINMITNF